MSTIYHVVAVQTNVTMEVVKAVDPDDQATEKTQVEFSDACMPRNNQ